MRRPEDVVAAVRLARSRGLPWRARGAGHSTAGQAQVAGGVVIWMRDLCAVLDVGRDFVDVEAGATWRSVLAATLPHGLTPPVLTDYLDLTVGGTLSVGGLGGASHRHGAQTDGVLELTVVTEAGELVTCSSGELFDAVRAGRGRHGVITRARLRLVPAPEVVTRYTLHYPSLGVFLRDQRAAMANADHLAGKAKWTAVGWRYELELTRYSHSDPPALSFVDAEVEHPTHWELATRMDEGERRLRALGEWTVPHPWANHFVPASAAEDVLGQVLTGLTGDDIGRNGTVLTYPVLRSVLATPGMVLPDEPVSHLFALLRVAAPDGPISAEAMVESNRVVARLVADAGGTEYLDALD